MYVCTVAQKQSRLLIISLNHDTITPYCVTHCVHGKYGMSDSESKGTPFQPSLLHCPLISIWDVAKLMEQTGWSEDSLSLPPQIGNLCSQTEPHVLGVEWFAVRLDEFKNSCPVCECEWRFCLSVCTWFNRVYNIRGRCRWDKTGLCLSRGRLKERVQYSIRCSTVSDISHSNLLHRRQ